MDKGFESDPEDVNESAPHVTMVGYATTVEHAHHQELSVSHRMGKTNLQLAAYTDRISDPALIGVGEYTTDNGNVLPDLFSGTFTYQGSNFHTQGMRVVVATPVQVEVDRHIRLRIRRCAGFSLSRHSAAECFAVRACRASGKASLAS